MSITVPNALLSIPRHWVSAIALPLTLGLLSGRQTAQVVDGTWYKTLKVPPGRPPRQVFPIVWSMLYISMGYASHLAVKALDTSVISATRSKLHLALGLYYAQLGLNILWTPLFFGSKQTGYALVDSTAIAGSTIYMTYLLHGPTNGQTTWFLAPYCAWLSFATYLNGGIWFLNRGHSNKLE